MRALTGIRPLLYVAGISLTAALSLAGCGSPAPATIGAAAPTTAPPATTAPATTATVTPTSTATAATDPAVARPVDCTKAGRAASSGPISAGDLCNATLQIPSWGAGIDSNCPHGSVKLTGGASKPGFTGVTINLVGIANVAVTGPAASDAAVAVACHVGDPALVQLAVFSRSAAAMHTVGQVVGPILNGQSIRVLDFHSPTVGTVLVEVSPCFGSDGRAWLAEVHQWRGYHVDGQRFIQTSGSTTFDANTATTRLTVAPPKVAFAKGSSHATLAVVVTNSGVAPATTCRSGRSSTGSSWSRMPAVRTRQPATLRPWPRAATVRPAFCAEPCPSSRAPAGPRRSISRFPRAPAPIRWRTSSSSAWVTSATAPTQPRSRCRRPPQLPATGAPC